MIPCADPSACLEERKKQFALADPVRRPWHKNPCENCKAGKERAIAHHRPEPDSEPYRAAQFKAMIGGPPCPVCHKPRPPRKTINPNKPCYDCQRRDPDFIQKRREYARQYHHEKKGRSAKQSFREKKDRIVKMRQRRTV